MPVSDGTYLDDLSIDEFDPVIVLKENPGFGHADKFVHREEFLCGVEGHSVSLHKV